ncbi:MAG: hypothetical protein JXB88_04475 [Spirochaetales bacterium]|nr:hypothetical protein [Spirochaetales bacterium]
MQTPWSQSAQARSSLIRVMVPLDTSVVYFLGNPWPISNFHPTRQAGIYHRVFKTVKKPGTIHNIPGLVYFTLPD